jgi:hypothetical protein
MLEGKSKPQRSARPVIRDFSDPGYARVKPQQKSQWGKVIVISLASILCVVGTLTLVTRSPWFFVHDIKIDGLEFVSESAVRDTVNEVLDTKRYGYFPERHRMFVDMNAIKEELQKDFAFSEVTVGERGGVVSVGVRERPTGVFVTDGKHQIFTDLEGIVIRDADDSEKDLVGKSGTSLPFLLLFVESELDVKPGDRLFSDDLLPNYQSLKLHFEVETGLPVYQYLLPRPNASWMKIRLADKREIYIDMTRAIEPQIQKLLTLMKTKGKELDTVSYVDLRYNDRVYFK